MVREKYHNVVCPLTRDYIVVLRDNEGNVAAQAQFGDVESYNGVQYDALQALKEGRINNESFVLFREEVMELFAKQILVDLTSNLFKDIVE